MLVSSYSVSFRRRPLSGRKVLVRPLPHLTMPTYIISTYLPLLLEYHPQFRYPIPTPKMSTLQSKTQYYGGFFPVPVSQQGKARKWTETQLRKSLESPRAPLRCARCQEQYCEEENTHKSCVFHTGKYSKSHPTPDLFESNSSFLLNLIFRCHQTLA